MYIPSYNLGLIPKRYLTAAVLFIITLFFFTGNSGTYVDSLRTQIADLTHPAQDVGWTTRQKFVDRVLANDFYVTEYDGAAVRKVCGETKWRDDRIVECNRIAGGIGNLKLNLLGCIRFSIESGAILITPVIHPREAFGEMTKSFAWDKDLPVSYMFDSEYFFSHLAKDCPQLRIVDKNDPLYNIPPDNEVHMVRPKALIPAEHSHVLIDPSLWRPAFDTHVDKMVTENNLTQPTKEHPIRISFDDTAFAWPVRYDSAEFQSDFALMLRFPRHIRELSARALYKLYQKLGIEQSPAGPSEGAFLGAHIRTEPDAQFGAWSTFEQQSAKVRRQLERYPLPVVYVATGTASEVDRLRADLADVRVRVNNTHETGVQVLQKWDLFDEADLLIIDTLTWDQMGLIDLDIMLRASRFVGTWESSWVWTIAIKRHAWSHQNPYDYAAHPVTFEDEFSIIDGPPGAQPIIAPCMWL